METDRLKKVTAHSLANQARTLIRDAIFEGKIKPEERLTIERIANELGISRTPVREALKLLEADGILKILPNRGAIVQRFDKEELSERYAVRALLESYAAELACARQTDELVARLEDNCLRMERGITELEQINLSGQDDLEKISSLLELNREFHDLILEASGAGIVIKLLSSLQMPVAYRLYQWRVPARRSAVLDYHRMIVERFRKKDPSGAGKAMKDHIHDVREFLLSTV